MEQWELVEQLRDIWAGRETYNDDDEWIDNLGSIIDELVKAFDLEINIIVMMTPQQLAQGVDNMQ